MTANEHTLGKWYAEYNEDSYIIHDGNKYGISIATLFRNNYADNKANAEHIVKCVNNFLALVKAIQYALKACEGVEMTDYPIQDVIDELKTALKDAEE